jgi:hypothetical protein
MDWEVGFEELVEYNKKHGSCVIPKQKKKGEYESLHAWVSPLLLASCFSRNH